MRPVLLGEPSVEMIEERGPRARRITGARRQALDVAREEPVAINRPDPGRTMPLVISPAADHVDLAEWVGARRDRLDRLLLEHGAILFRGFPLRSARDFEAVALAFYGDLYGDYGDLPREGISGRIYASTPYPHDQMILYHNESSHLHRWPMKIGFFCV